MLGRDMGDETVVVSRFCGHNAGNGVLNWRSGFVVTELDCDQTTSEFVNGEDGFDCKVYHITVRVSQHVYCNGCCVYHSTVFVITRHIHDTLQFEINSIRYQVACASMAPAIRI